MSAPAQDETTEQLIEQRDRLVLSLPIDVQELFWAAVNASFACGDHRTEDDGDYEPLHRAAVRTEVEFLSRIAQLFQPDPELERK